MVEKLIAELAGGRELIAQAEALDKLCRYPFSVMARANDVLDVAQRMKMELRAQAEQPAEQGEPVAWTRWTMPDLCRLYAYAYRAGHEDTCEATYTHVVEADVETYHEDEVVEYLCDHEKRAHPDPRIAALTDLLERALPLLRGHVHGGGMVKRIEAALGGK